MCFDDTGLDHLRLAQRLALKKPQDAGVRSRQVSRIEPPTSGIQRELAALLRISPATALNLEGQTAGRSLQDEGAPVRKPSLESDP
jgi:hypothetical protein